MKALWIACLFWLLLGGGISLASAQTIARPDVVSVVVADESEATRQAAVETAMAKLIIRLTGDRNLPQTEVGESLQDQAQRYLVGFTYRQAPIAGEDQAAPMPRLRETRLEVRFLLRDIERELVRAGVEIWPMPAPTAVIWLAIEADGERRIAETAQDAQWLEALRAQADAQGVRIILPLMDLEDLSSLSYADIAAGFVEPIRAASQRYGVDETLAGRVQILPDGRVNARWLQIGEAEGVRRWQDAAAAMPDILTRAADRLVAQLRREYAYLPDLSAQRQLRVEVSGIDSLARHEQLVERLEAIGGIERARLERMSGNTVVFSLAITVDEERVISALARDARLQTDGDGYRWR